MSNEAKIPSTIEAWESGALGNDEEHAHRVSDEQVQAVDEALGLQMISIRLEKSLITTFKNLAEYHGVGYQPLMRDALKRFADSEMKNILAELVASQRKTPGTEQPQSKKKTSKTQTGEKKAA